MVTNNTDPSVFVDGRLIEDIREFIESSKSRFAQAANTMLVTLYWNIGKRIKIDILGNERAQYGKEIVSALSRQLMIEYGTGFSEKNLRHMIHFAETYPDEQIVSALKRQLSWSHFKDIIYINDELKRDFYAEMCRVE